MHAMPRKAGFHGCRQKLRGLPRRYSSPQIWIRLRAMPHGSRMEHYGSAGEGSPEPIPALWRTCGGAVRGMSQERCRRAVPRTLNAMYFVPSEGLSADDEPESRQREVLDYLRDVSQLRYVVECQI